MKRVAAGIVAALTAMMLSGCGVSVPSDMVAIHMGDGSWENKKPKGCIPPGTKDNSLTNDEYPKYPVNEREWDATGQDGSDSEPMKSVTKDNVEMHVPLTIRFNIIAPKAKEDKEACDTLTEFHMKFGRRYGVEFDDDGSYNKAWETLLRKLIADPTETALDRIVQDYNWRQVWNDPATKAAIEKSLLDGSDDIATYINRGAKGVYFENFTVTMSKAEPVNAALREAVANEQNLVAQSQSREAEADAKAAEARARVAVARAEAAERRAQIAGYGSVEAYLKAKCIEGGNCNPWQPVIIGPVPAQ